MNYGGLKFFICNELVCLWLLPLKFQCEKHVADRAKLTAALQCVVTLKSSSVTSSIFVYVWNEPFKGLNQKLFA